jgi:RNA polymerase sporulation-specific sigma factor
MSGIMVAVGYILKEIVTFVSYVKNNAFPQPLTPDDERKHLSLLELGNLQSRNILIEHNLRLVAHIVKRLCTV